MKTECLKNVNICDSGNSFTSKLCIFYHSVEEHLYNMFHYSFQFLPSVSIQSLSRVRPFVTPWAAALQASLPITNSRSPSKPMSIESMVPSNRPILCHPLLLLLPIFPSIRVFSNESTLHIRWPKYWSLP